MPLTLGDNAPDFTLPRQDGTPVHLSELLKRGPVVVYFYPRDETPGCTAQACAFRDAYEDFKAAGAEVVGISSDTQESHASFAQRRQLPFILLSDADGSVRKRYGVKPSFLGMVPGRETFLIDSSGTIRHVFDSALNPTKHVKESLRVLREITGHDRLPRTTPHPLGS